MELNTSTRAHWNILQRKQNLKNTLFCKLINIIKIIIKWKHLILVKGFISEFCGFINVYFLTFFNINNQKCNSSMKNKFLYSVTDLLLFVATGLTSQIPGIFLMIFFSHLLNYFRFINFVFNYELTELYNIIRGHPFSLYL